MLRCEETDGRGQRLTWGEPLSVLLRAGLDDLVHAHWEESAADTKSIPFAVDWDRYHRMEAFGIYRKLTAWHGSELVGYNAFMVMPHKHHARTLFALNDVLYVAPARRGALGVRLIRQAERDLFASGVVKIRYDPPAHVLLGRDGARKQRARPMLAQLLVRLGYRHEGDVFSKVAP